MLKQISIKEATIYYSSFFRTHVNVEYFNRPTILRIHHFPVRISGAHLILAWGFVHFRAFFPRVFVGYLEIPQRWGRFLRSFFGLNHPLERFCWIDDPSLGILGPEIFEGQKKHIELVEVHLLGRYSKTKTKQK